MRQRPHRESDAEPVTLAERILWARHRLDEAIDRMGTDWQDRALAIAVVARHRELRAMEDLRDQQLVATKLRDAAMRRRGKVA